MKLINGLLISVSKKYRAAMTDEAIERCAQICDKNARDAEEMYAVLREIASHPDTDFGVMKYVCYAGQSERDARNIRELKHG